MNSWMRLRRFSACLRNEIPTRRPNQGESGVWIGGIPTPWRWRKLRARGIRTVIALTDEFPPPPWIQVPDLHWIRVLDYHSPTVEQFRDACARLDAAVAAGQPSLIYCGAGQGRAATAYAAWLIRRGADVADALARLSHVRPVAKPTERQLQALGSWSEVCRRKR